MWPTFHVADGGVSNGRADRFEYSLFKVLTLPSAQRFEFALFRVVTFSSSHFFE